MAKQNEPPPVHPLARTALRGIYLPDPEQREDILNTRKVADLVSNINPYRGELAHYPASHPVPIQEIYARFLRDELPNEDLPHVAPSAENILFTCGSVEGISLLVAAFCEPFKDCVCVCDPTFPFYARAANCNDVAVRHVPLQGRNFNSFDIQTVLSHRPKLTFLCSPGNPVGTTLDPACIIELLKADCGLVVVDEAYIEFSSQPSVLRWLATSPKLVVLRTFSKAWGLAGVRIGAAIATPLILYTLRLVQLTYAFGAPAQRHVLDALANLGRLEQDVREIRTQRDRLAQDLGCLTIVKQVFPSDTNFLLVAFDDALPVYHALLDAGILVGDTRNQVPETLRISTGIAEHCMRVVEVLRRMPPTRDVSELRDVRGAPASN
jgi:histidinol-phosphate aminotransferase